MSRALDRAAQAMERLDATKQARRADPTTAALRSEHVAAVVLSREVYALADADVYALAKLRRVELEIVQEEASE